MIAINAELKAQAVEKEREARAAGDQPAGAAAGRGQGGRMGPSGKPARPRTLKDTPAPQFVLAPSTSQVKTFRLTTPTTSQIRFGPSTFRPTIQLDDRYIAFAASPEAAQAALTAVRKRDWRPSASLQKASAEAPANLVMLGVTDVAESLPSFLARLPGTLQTMINSSLAVAKADNGSAPAQAAGGGPRANADGATPGPGGLPGRRGGMMVRGGGPAGTPAPSPAATNPSSSGSSSEAGTVTFQIDADKLPKSSDLKALVFPSTYSISVTDKEIRFVNREAFPDVSVPIGLVPLAFVMPSVRAALEKLQATPAQEAQAAGAGSQPGAAAPAPAAAAPATPKAQPPGGRRGRRGAE
jgi:hypothetical protein